MPKKKEISFDIVKHIGVISEGSKGWKRELNSVSWNGAEPKYDIRDWSPEHDKMGKGIVLAENELIQLRNLINEVFSDTDTDEFISSLSKWKL